MFTAYIHNEISRICPILGISIGKKEDKSTWRIDFDSASNKEQKLAVQRYIDNFDNSIQAIESFENKCRNNELITKFYNNNEVNIEQLFVINILVKELNIIRALMNLKPLMINEILTSFNNKS